MKILLTSIFDRKCPLTIFADHYYRWFVANIPNADVKFLVSEAVYKENQKQHLLDVLNPVLISEEEIDIVFGSKNIGYNSDVYARIFKDGLTKDESKKLQDLIKSKFNDWLPDIVFTQGSEPVFYWQSVFPKTLCLNQENAIFSRPPFKRTLSYDPYQSIPNNFLVRFADDIKSFKITKEENNQIERFKKSLTGIIDKYSPLDDAMVYYYKQKFDKLVLLPLVGDYIIKLFCDCIYDNEFDLVESVMKNTPQNIGVFVTQHDSSGSLSPENIKYFQSTYPNFIFLQQTNIRGFANNSLNYFQYVDAVLNITSKAGYMAMIWDKPVISLAKNYNLWYQDGAGIEDLERVLNTPYKNKNNVLYWYFTHYVVFFQDFGREDFLYNFLNNLLENFRNNGINFDFYPQINDFDKIFDYVLPKAIDVYQGKQHVLDEIEQKIEVLSDDKVKEKKYISGVERRLELLIKKSFKYKFVRVMSHITFGKIRKYFQNKKNGMLNNCV